MKVSVELPDEVVKEICRITGEDKKSIAVRKYALEALNDLRRQEADAKKAKRSQQWRANQK